MAGKTFLTASISLWLSLTGAYASDGTFAATGPASAPASQPADQMVLIRIGDRATITQADFEKAVRYEPAKGYQMRDPILLAMVQDRLLGLYAADHPEWVTEKDLDAKIAATAKATNFDSVETFRKAYESRGGNWAEYRRLLRLSLARARFADRGAEAIADEEKLKEIFAARKWEFDETAVNARQIYVFMPVYATPAEREAARKKLAQMREDILAGKRTWEQCVKESDSALSNSDLGRFPRHLVQPEVVGEAAFKLQAGQMSDVVESPVGYHLVQVTERIPPNDVPWESFKKNAMKRWIEQEEYFNALEETRRKYPVVGVQPPREPKDPPASRPAPTTTHPKPKRTPAFVGDKPPAWTVRTATSTSPAASAPAKRSTATVPARQRHKAPTTRPAKTK